MQGTDTDLLTDRSELVPYTYRRRSQRGCRDAGSPTPVAGIPSNFAQFAGLTFCYYKNAPEYTTLPDETPQIFSERHHTYERTLRSENSGYADAVYYANIVKL